MTYTLQTVVAASKNQVWFVLNHCRSVPRRLCKVECILVNPGTVLSYNNNPIVFLNTFFKKYIKNMLMVLEVLKDENVQARRHSERSVIYFNSNKIN